MFWLLYILLLITAAKSIPVKYIKDSEQKMFLMTPHFEDVDAEPAIEAINTEESMPQFIQPVTESNINDDSRNEPLQQQTQFYRLPVVSNPYGNIVSQENSRENLPRQTNEQGDIRSSMNSLNIVKQHNVLQNNDYNLIHSNDKYVQNYIDTMSSYLNGDQKGYTLNPQSDLENEQTPVHTNPETITEIKTASEAGIKRGSANIYKRVFNETVVEVIGDENASNNNTASTDELSDVVDQGINSVNHTYNETEEFRKLLDEAKQTKEQIEKLSEKLEDDSDIGTNNDNNNNIKENNNNETTTEKKSTLDSLQNDISVERGVRQLLVKHLIQVQIEDRRREEALENILKHYDVESNELKKWNMSQGALKAILRAKANILSSKKRKK